MKQKNHPGVYLPPPLVYVAFFFLSIFIQNNIPINANWQNTIQANVIGWILIIISGLFIVSALQRFITSRNTLITVSYTHLRAHETDSYLVCRLLLEKKKTTKQINIKRKK